MNNLQTLQTLLDGIRQGQESVAIVKSYADGFKAAKYIKSINPIQPPKAFNYSPQVFAIYCNAQARAMLEWGHVEWAEVKDIRNAALIANRADEVLDNLCRAKAQ